MTLLACQWPIPKGYCVGGPGFTVQYNDMFRQCTVTYHWFHLLYLYLSVLFIETQFHGEFKFQVERETLRVRKAVATKSFST